MVRRPTLKDVGAAAGVSIYTASRALRNESGVAPATREKVHAAASNLGYVRNEVAAGLKMKKTHTVGILTASGRNQYYTMLVQVIDDILHDHGYFAVTNDAIKDKGYSEGSEVHSVKLLLEQRPAAVIATYALSKESLQILHSFHIPVVFVDSQPANDSLYPFVGSDNFQAGQIGGDYLAALGHKHVLALTYPSTWRTGEPRLEGLKSSALQHDIKIEIAVVPDNPESAKTALIKRFSGTKTSSLPDAVFAFNTLMAMGAYQAFKELKITIGSDISLLSIDDFDWATLLDPPLTVIAQNLEEIGRQAARFTIDAIHGNALTGQRLTVPVHLIKRESCLNLIAENRKKGGDTK